MMINEILQEKLKLLPTKSGVYLMKNKQKKDTKAYEGQNHLY